MPRKARIDICGLMYHIIARGIEGKVIFRDQRDYKDFLGSLNGVVTRGKARLFAWCLMPNHFHLLMRPEISSLSNMMRSLMTGYAVRHNHRHKRKGHLFQNRYKSIIVQEEPHFLELVRYINLNPVRAGIVRTMEDLAGFPYSSHAVIMGKKVFSCQDVDGLLHWFSNTKREAIRQYLSFVASGYDRLKNDYESEKSTGGYGKKPGMPGADAYYDIASDDDRILGHKDFADRILNRVDRARIKSRPSIEEILSEVEEEWGVEAALILGGSRERRISRARREFFLRAHEKAGYTLSHLGRLSKRSHVAVKKAIERAKQETDDRRLT